MKKISPIILGSWIAVFGFAFYLLVTLQNQRAAIEQEAQGRTLALTRLIAEHAANNIDMADLVLQGVVDSLGRPDLANPKAISEPRRQSVVAMLKTLQARSQGSIVSMSLTDADGVVFANTVGTPPGVSLADREYFLELKAGPERQPAVSELIYGRVSKKWGVQVARRIEHADGMFAGMIVANLGITDAFEGFYRTLNVERDMFITLRNDNNQILVRYPKIEDVLGTVISGSPATQAVLAGDEERVVRSVSPIDNIERIVGLRKVTKYPIYASVGLSVNVVLAKWRAQVGEALFMLLGACLAGVGLSVAIHRREKMSLELEQHKLDLESEVQERTAALISAKEAAEAANRAIVERKEIEVELIAAKHDAENASLAKSRFLAAASHDLRQPMQAIGLFQNALTRTELNPEQKRFLDYLGQSTRSMGEILNALLDISKLDAGMVEVSREVISAQSLVQKINAEFGLLAASKSLRFKLGFPLRDMTMLTDRKLLMDLLRNLIGNAIKYTDKGGVLVAIRHRGHQALIQVWDTGIGIAGEHLDTIYDEYFQVGNDERDRSKGLGLGLAIARRIANLLETEIRCHSRPGKGSVFEFRLPLVTSAENAPSIQSDPPKVTDSAKPTGCYVVLVENDLMVGTAAKLALESCGMTVVRYKTAEDALADPDIAGADFYIADLRLPGKNGIEFLDTVQQRATKQIKAVVLTGDTALNRIEMMRSTQWQVLFKPVDLANLLAAIEARHSGQ